MSTAVRDELTDRYGPPPVPVLNLLEVARLREQARRAGLTDITLQGAHIRFAPVQLPDSREVRVHRLYPKTVLKQAVRTMLVPVPRAQLSRAPGPRPRASPGAQLLRDQELLAWCAQLVETIFGGCSRPADRSVRRDRVVLRISISSSCGQLAVVALAVLALTACGPVQMGSAAIVGGDRISASTLTTEVNNLNDAYHARQGAARLPDVADAAGGADLAAAGSGSGNRSPSATASPSPRPTSSGRSGDRGPGQARERTQLSRSRGAERPAA